MGKRAELYDYFHQIYLSLFARTWPKWVAGLLLGLVNVLMFAYLKPWGVFPPMSMWGAWLYNLMGIKTEAPFGPLVAPHLDVGTVLDGGIILGALMAALLSWQFKIRRESFKGYIQGFVGGIIMGFGTVLTPPCNVGGFFSAISALSLSGFVMMAGLVPGAYLGARVMMLQARRQVDVWLTRPAGVVPAIQGGSLSKVQPLIGAVVFFLLVVLALAYGLSGRPTLAGMLLFGTAFGLIIQRAGFCFAGAFREIFTTRNNETMRAIVLGLTVGVLGFAIIKANGFRPADTYVFPVGWHTLLGGFIFGFGMVIVGGCGTGLLWRTAEGYIRIWFALLGGVLASGSWTLIYGYQVGKGWLYGPKVFMPNIMGWVPAILAILVAIWAWYAFVTWMELRKRGG